MSNEKASKSQEPSESAKPTDDLSDDELAKVAGGAVAVEHEIVSPRDAASGLPTGKRMHKPIS